MKMRIFGIIVFMCMFSMLNAQNYVQWNSKMLEIELDEKARQQIDGENVWFVANDNFKITVSHFNFELNDEQQKSFLEKIVSQVVYLEKYNKGSITNEDFLIEYVTIGYYNKIVAAMYDIVQPNNLFVLSIEYGQGMETEAREMLSSCRKIVNKSLEGLTINSDYYKTKNQKKTWDFFRQYSFDGFYLMQQYYSLPNQAQSGYTRINLGNPVSFTDYMNGRSEKDFIRSLETIIHEINHVYTYKKGIIDGVAQEGLIDELNRFASFYIGNGKTILVIRGKVFPSKELHEGFPEQGKSFRYDTYINTDKEIMMTQQSGVYGLLDEYNAYYYSTKLALELYPYYESKAEADVHAWHEFLQHFYGSYYAYAEFKLYITHYLWYAKKNHTEVYKDALENDNFRLVLKTVDKNWVRVLADFENLKQKMINNIQEQHSSFTEDQEYSYINSKGAGNFMGEFNRLVYVLQNPMYESILKEFELFKPKAVEMHE